MSNAIKYTNEGQIVLTIDFRDSSLIMEIQDTGIGMSPDYFKKIFQPFEQESTGNARLYDGTGLGLSITKNLVNMLGGQITIKSKKKPGNFCKAFKFPSKIKIFVVLNLNRLSTQIRMNV